MPKLLRPLVPALALAALAVLAAAVPAAAEQVTLPSPVSPNGQHIIDLYNLISIPAAIIFLGVEGTLVLIIIRFRRRRADQVPPQWHGNNRLELVWTIIPLLLILSIGAVSFSELQQDFRKVDNANMEVTVVGHQFYWEYIYPYQTADGQPLTTRNTLTVPTNRVVRLRFQSPDVIHSWWVPAITGKTDAVPGYDNFSWLNISQQGEWHGECAELCGSGHSEMMIDVRAIDDFDQWVSEQTAPPPSPTPSRSASPTPSASPSPGVGATASPSAGVSASPAATPSVSPRPTPS